MPHSMSVYRDAVRSALAVRYPEIRTREIMLDAWPLRVGRGFVNRYLRYFPAARRLSCSVAHILDQNNAPLALFLPHGTYVVLTVHDYNPAFMGRGGALFYFMQGKGILRADAISVPSEATRKDLLEALPLAPERVHLIPNGVDGQTFTPDAQTTAGETTWDVRKGWPRLLHVGSDVKRKNLNMLFSVFARLKLEYPDAVLLRVGTQSAAYRKSLRALGVEESVVHYPTSTGKALAALYRSADVMLFPSRFEGFGLPVLEAMACGCPVVSSNASSLPEVGGDAVCYAPPDDIDGWLAAIGSVLSDGALRQALRSAGLRRAAAFTWERHVDGLVKLYHGVSPAASR